MSKVLSRMALLGALLVPGWAYADDWGCTVLLCLADPRGPTTESECRPPIEKLWEHLAKFKPFPTCAFASGPKGDSYGSMAYVSHGEKCEFEQGGDNGGLVKGYISWRAINVYIDNQFYHSVPMPTQIGGMPMCRNGQPQMIPH